MCLIKVKALLFANYPTLHRHWDQMKISPRGLHKEDNVCYNKHHFTASLKEIEL